MNPVCENCKWWFDERFTKQGIIGECRRHAPVIKGKDDCAHPVTVAMWACGDFTPSNEALN